MRTPEEIIKAMTADNRHILSATNEELSELILAIREYACDNHLQIKPLYEGWLVDIAYRIASPAQKKAWGNWADNQDVNKPGLDISDAASALGKKGGSAKTPALKLLNKQVVKIFHFFS